MTEKPPDDETTNGPGALKRRILDELSAWSAELSDISSEVERAPVPTDTGEEASSYARASERVEGLVEEVNNAAITPVPYESALEIQVDETDSFSEPAYRFEAFAHPPWETHAVGGLVGYSDVSASQAATQLRLLLCDLGVNLEVVKLHDAHWDIIEEPSA